MDNPRTVRNLTTNTTWTIPQLSENLPQIQHGQSYNCQKAYHKYNIDNPTAVRKLTTYITWTIPQLSESSPALIKPQGTYNIRARVNRFLSHHSVAVTARKEVEDKCDRYAKSTNKCEMPITQSWTTPSWSSSGGPGCGRKTQTLVSCYSLGDPSRGTCINRLWRRAGGY